MRVKTVRLMGVCVIAMLTGCCGQKGARAPDALPAAGREAKMDGGNTAVQKEGRGEPAVVREAADVRVPALEVLDRAEEVSDPPVEDGENMESDPEFVLADTVEYVEPSRETIWETRRVETVVDENDPSTYEVVREEKETEEILEFPVEYTDSAGNVKYAFLDGMWYDYCYSSGDIVLAGARDDGEALSFLNLFGDYDGYETVKVECTRIEEAEDEQYSYHVLYRMARPLPGEPDLSESVAVSRTRREMARKTQVVERKVPVLRGQKVDTGEFVRHGWQEMNGGTYYFDKSGEKVTGMQVIRGLCFLFDSEGVLRERSGVSVSERNGRIDWERITSAGIGFAVIRCGYRGAAGGRIMEDARCAENIEGAGSAGLEVYLRFYSQAVSKAEAEEEAAYLVSMARTYGISTPLIVSTGYTKGIGGRGDGLSRKDRTACMEAFCSTVESAGYPPMLCADKEWLENGLDMDVLKGRPVWLSQYNTDVTYAGGYVFWQYTGAGILDGADGHVGLSIRK